MSQKPNGYVRTFRSIGFANFQSWFHVEVETDETSRYVYACSTIHVNKRVRVGPSFSLEFTSLECVLDANVTSAIYAKFGDVISRHK